jgi:hypothetical protein
MQETYQITAVLHRAGAGRQTARVPPASSMTRETRPATEEERACRRIKIGDLVFPPVVPPLASPVLWLVFRFPLTQTQDQHGRYRRRRAVMDWPRPLADITGTVEQALLRRHESLVTEKRLLRHQTQTAWPLPGARAPDDAHQESRVLPQWGLCPGRRPEVLRRVDTGRGARSRCLKGLRCRGGCLPLTMPIQVLPWSAYCSGLTQREPTALVRSGVVRVVRAMASLLVRVSWGHWPTGEGLPWGGESIHHRRGRPPDNTWDDGSSARPSASHIGTLLRRGWV